MPPKYRKIIYVDDEEMVWCSHEKQYVSSFEFETNDKGNYKQFCINCSEKIYEGRNMNYAMGAKERNEYVEAEAKKMLENLGYDYQSNIPIHEQFKLRHQDYFK